MNNGSNKILFATNNQAKVQRYKTIIDRAGIELIILKDIDQEILNNIKVEETGKNAIENAVIKAESYSKALNIITLGVDDTLYIEGVPEDMQPGVFVRRADKKHELSDEEMLDYYKSLVKKYKNDKGYLVAKWVYGVAVSNGKETYTELFEKDNYYLVEEECEEKNVGYPLNSITINPKTNKYVAQEVNEKEKKTDLSRVNEKIANFVIESFQKIK